ncbi:hypothetical protein ROU88_09665 [Macrococcus capreoli]
MIDFYEINFGTKTGWSKETITTWSPFIIAIITVWVNLYLSRKQLLNSLDDKSDWRKRLYDVSSTSPLGINEVLTVRTSLRYVKKDTNKLSPFDIVTNEIIDFCECIEQRYDTCNNPQKFILTSQERKLIQLYTRYLLKHHWEEYQLKWYKKPCWNEKEEKLIEKMKQQPEYTYFNSTKNR